MFSITRTAITKVLSLLYAQQFSVGVLSVALRPYFFIRNLFNGSKATASSQATRSAMILFESIVDAFNIILWITIALVIADVMFGDRRVFNFLDANRWIGFSIFALIAFRFLVRSEGRKVPKAKRSSKRR